ncbi:dienelactone hydrolase family protein [Streptomyces beijiangensis]|uniref:Dienelactone hydrolase family protein n=1 Tax=Streptomyces beijiangensis TaxID=163361 RepID=A0A939FBN9_9ACTN|nr:dienelactone hydrolase family protein [Streptomyces beijiangensis]MBO0515608.1 dienelactone hydrolase family protein [Streptomyces beijiangensis]
MTTTTSAWADIDGMDAFVARPDAPGSHPGVILAPELFGLDDNIKETAHRLAALGFTVVAPDFHHRTQPRAALAGDEAGRKRGFELLTLLTREGVLADVEATMRHLREYEGAGGRIGMVGFSAGGHMAYLSAARLPLLATAVIYPGWLTVTDIPLSTPEPTLTLTPGITGRLLFVVGDEDHVISQAQRGEIERELKASGVRHDFVVYPGAGHPFLFEGRETYDADAAADTWRRVEELLRDELRR